MRENRDTGRGSSGSAGTAVETATDGASWRRRGGLGALLAGGLALGGGLALLLGRGGKRVAVGDGSALDPAEDSSGRGRPGVPASARARRAGHETTDASARAAASTLAVFAAAALGSVVLAVVGLGWLHRADRAGLPPLTSEQRASIEPPAPRLQEHAMREIADVRAHEDSLLNGYAWANAGHTRARIPVARAMALMVGRPLDPPPP